MNIEKHDLKHLFSEKSLEGSLCRCVGIGGFGFFDGGCLVFADALKMVIPNSKIVTIVRGGKRRADHYGLKTPSGTILDFGGEHSTPWQWIQRFCFLESIHHEKLDYADELVPSSEIPRNSSLSQDLAGILAAGKLTAVLPKCGASVKLARQYGKDGGSRQMCHQM